MVYVRMKLEKIQFTNPANTAMMMPVDRRAAGIDSAKSFRDGRSRLHTAIEQARDDIGSKRHSHHDELK